MDADKKTDQKLKIGKNGWKSLLAVAISIAILWVIFWKFDVLGALRLIARADWRYLLILLAAAILLIFVAPSDKWRRMLRDLGLPLPFRKVFPFMMGSLPLKFITPARVGELSRAFYLNRKYGFPLAKGVSVILFNKVLIMLALFFYMGVGSLLVDLPYFPRGIFAILFAAVALLLWARPLYFALLYPIEQFRGRPWQGARDLVGAFHELTLPQRLWYFGYSLLVEFNYVLDAWLVFMALGVNVPFAAVMAFSPLSVFIGTLPVGVAGFGTREAVFLFCFSPYGSPEAILGAALLFGTVEYVIPSLFGTLYLKDLLLTIGTESNAQKNKSS